MTQQPIVHSPLDREVTAAEESVDRDGGHGVEWKVVCSLGLP